MEGGLGLLKKQNLEWGMPGGDGGSMSLILCDLSSLLSLCFYLLIWNQPPPLTKA